MNMPIMNGVEQAGARSRREESDIGSADDSLLDPVDVLRGLAHMDVLRIRVRDSRAHRLLDIQVTPRTSAEEHLAEFGHELEFGCCKEEVNA